MIRYYDEHGKEIHMRTELDDALDALLDSYYDMLSKMTAEQRMNYFKYEQFVAPLPSTTLYISLGDLRIKLFLCSTFADLRLSIVLLVASASVTNASLEELFAFDSTARIG